MRSSESATLWEGLFLDADLIFVFTPECWKSINVDSDYAYFNFVMAGNPYTPLQNFVFCHFPSHFMMLEIFYSQDGYKPVEKVARPTATFIPLHRSMGYATIGRLKSELLIHIVDKVLRPSYIFGHTQLYRDGAPSNHIAQFLYKSKLIIFEDSITSPLFIPCLTCHPVVSSRLATMLSLANIRIAWNAQNMNMHKYYLFVNDKVSVKCGLLHIGVANQSYHDVCQVVEIAKKYNLTLLEYKRDFEIFITNPSFGIAIFVKYNEIHFDQHVYQVDFVYTNFITVTNPPSPASGIATFVYPFDWETWTSLLVTIISAAACLTLLVPPGLGNGSWIDCAAIMMDKMITVANIFLGNIGETSGKAYRTAKAAFILLALWFFGYMFLIVNFYQGSIYSYLTVPVLPKTPGDIQELANSDISMVAMDTYINELNFLEEPTLLDNIIPQLISSPGNSPEFIQFIKQIQQKTLSINDQTVAYLVDKIMSENSTRTHPMIALLIAESKIQYLTKVIKIFGNRHIVTNIGKSPIRTIKMTIGNTNLLSAYFSNDWERMKESGLSKMWAGVFSVSTLLREKETLLRMNNYFKAVQRSFGHLKEKITIHESSPVSLDRILPAFFLCSVPMVLGLVAFVTENRKYLTVQENTIILTEGLLNFEKFCIIWCIYKYFTIRRRLVGHKATRTIFA